MKKFNCFYIIMMCALSACSVQADEVIKPWYEVTKLLPWKVEHGGRGHSGFWGSKKPFKGAEVVGAIGKGITSGYEMIRSAIEHMTPEYVRGVQQDKLLMNRYNPTSHYGGAEMSDFELLARALRGSYGPALQELAQQKENQLGLALAGEGLTQAAEAQIKSSWSNLGNFAKHHLGERLGSFWSNYASPGIEGLGNASRYLVPTGLSQYAQTFPTVQKFTNLPRETQNFYLGAVAAPLALAAAYKLGKGTYQWWNKPTIEQLQAKIENLEEQKEQQSNSWLNKARNYGSSLFPTSFW